MSAATWLVASTVVLTAGFFFNLWHAADPSFFRGFQRDTESLVMGRLVQARQDGPLSVAGLPGAFGDLDLRRQWVAADDVRRQYHGYLQGEHLDGFTPYLSHHGAQGVACALLDRALPLPPWETLYVLRLLTSLLTAAVLAAIVLWVRLEAGVGAASAALVSLAVSRWLAPFGHNLWWSPWALFLPMLAVAWLLWRCDRRVGRPATVAAVAAVAGGGILVKCAFTGYEFLTTVVVMVMVPVVLVAVRDRWSLRRLAARLAAAGLGAAAAVACSVVVLVLQVGSVAGGPSAAVDHLVRSAAKRTHGDGARFEGAFATALDAGVLEVVGESLHSPFVRIRSPLADEPTGEKTPAAAIRFWHLLILLAAASAGLRFLPRSGSERPLDRALVAAAWCSLLAPLSWYVVFTAHGAAHPHLDPVVWHMPFTIMAFAVVGRTVERAVTIGRRG